LIKRATSGAKARHDFFRDSNWNKETSTGYNYHFLRIKHSKGSCVDFNLFFLSVKCYLVITKADETKKMFFVLSTSLRVHSVVKSKCALKIAHRAFQTSSALSKLFSSWKELGSLLKRHENVSSREIIRDRCRQLNDDKKNRSRNEFRYELVVELRGWS
jgi:hypothetical protein